jgi:pyruvate dehydrogenase phosphatase
MPSSHGQLGPLEARFACHPEHRNRAMLPLQSGRVIGRGIASRTPCLGNPAAAGSRARFRLRTAQLTTPFGRVPPPQSRVQSTLHDSLPCRRGPAPLVPSRRHHVPTQSSAASIHLQSAFPTKTALFLLALGGIIYYLVDIIEEEDGWYMDMLLAYENDKVHVTPLVTQLNKEELDHWIQAHIPDTTLGIPTGEVFNFLSEQYDKLVGGWMMTKDNAKKEGLLVTHGCRFRSNQPCEDFHALGASPGPGANPWNYWSIMDGHAGHSTAMQLQWKLIPYVSSALSNLPATSSSPEVENVIKHTFLRIDNSIMDGARTTGNWYPAGHVTGLVALAPALSGSCALLAAFDPQKDVLRVACTGDSRAVLGRWDPDARSYTCIPLSEDQTGFNEKEVARLTQEHPDEPDMINLKSGRLLGLAVTRAFGDHRWKWDNDFVKAVQCKFWGPSPRPHNNTPPYLTAEPEITETKVVRADPEASGSDFMIMASDGLWDRISSEHAVECVERWLEAKRRGGGSVSKDPRLLANPPKAPSTLALEDGIEVDPEKGQDIDWKATPEYFAIEDENAAVCLARNAMGGTRRNLFTSLLSIDGPLTRNAVDDTTIMVVFFDKWGEHESPKPEAPKKSWWKPW